MARKIINLERNLLGFGAVNLTVVFWLDVASGNELPRPGFVSAIKGAADAPTPAEVTALVNGSVFELVQTFRMPSTYSNVQSQAFLQVHYAAAQAFITANPPGQFYGSNWDGTVWAG